MDTTVSARIPVEVKKQADKKLRDMGSSPTELINAAYRYVLKENRLPVASAKATAGKRKRSLNKEQQRQLKEFLAKATFAVPEEALEGKTYKEIIAEGRRADYEALA